MPLALDGLLVVVQLVVGHTVERILRVRRLVYGGIVLVAALDDALRGGAHQHDMVAGTGHGGVLDAARLVPGDALEDVRLRAGADLVRAPVVLDLLLQSLELLGAGAGRHELQRILDADRCRMVGRAVGHPLCSCPNRTQTIEQTHKHEHGKYRQTLAICGGWI